jgi:DNA polymerase
MSERKWTAAEMIKLAWRADNPAVVALWRSIDEAAIEATESPGRTVHAGEWLRYRRAGSWLFCRLPSGRVIVYPYPRVEWRETPWGTKKPTLLYKGVDSFSKRWEEHAFYGGLGTENAVQATARDIMREAMHRVAPDALILTIHDELVWEVDPARSSIDEFCRLSAEPLPWAPGLPIAVEGWAGPRYRK